MPLPHQFEIPKPYVEKIVKPRKKRPPKIKVKETYQEQERVFNDPRKLILKAFKINGIKNIIVNQYTHRRLNYIKFYYIYIGKNMYKIKRLNFLKNLLNVILEVKRSL